MGSSSLESSSRETLPRLPPWSDGWGRYGLMLGVVAVSTLVRFFLDPMVGTRLTFMTFFLAVFTTAWFAGLRPTIGATLLSLLIGVVFFDPPAAHFGLADPVNQVRYLFFSLTGVATGWMGETRLRALRTAQAAAQQAQAEAARAEAQRLRAEEQASKAEESAAELRGSEDRFRAMAETIPAMLFTIDAHDDFAYLNRRFFDYTGLAAGAPPQEAWRATLHPDDVEAIRTGWERARRTGESSQHECRLRGADGSYRWFVVRSRPIRAEDGSVARWFGYCIDVDDLKQAEAAARLSEQELSDFFENASVGLHSEDGRGVILRANRAELELLGYRADEYLGHSIAEFHVDPAVVEELLRRLAAGEIVQDAPARLRCKDGSIKDVLISSSVHWKDGAFGYTRSFTRDVTAQKRAEEAVRMLQRLESVGQLAGGVAHEVNNQMTVVLGATDFILRREDLPAPVRSDVQVVRDAAQRSAGITAQLLAFSRQQILRPEALDLNAVVAAFHPVILRAMGERYEVSLELGSGATCGRADRSQLEQVLLNLALNAADAMPDGGRLTLHTERVTLNAADRRLEHEPTVEPGEYLELTVTDTGIGMDAATLARVFEPFFTTKEVGRGTGLGLSTVYGIVRQSGGYIAVRSAPGKGSTFSVFLPATPEPARVAPEAAPDQTVHGEETILVVEDQTEVLRMVTRTLDAAGYHVIEAPDGAEALARAREHAGGLALVLTDLALPKLGGLALARELVDLVPGVPVLFMTGYANAEQVEGTALLGSYPMIEKPFTSDLLVRRIRETLEGARQRVTA
ncbi:MAG TPA: PAS domain S-box protein [Gemmatimonadales bacterium]|nr:PAS domain S-box protein [Gemmatimonadales bacterium]